MYNFNPAKKRMEPTEKKCQFCEMENSAHMEDNYFIPLYKENDRTNIIVYRSVKYSKIPIGIPRCPSCMAIHENAARKSALISGSIALGIIILSFLLWGPFGFFSIFAGIIIGFAGRYFIEKKMVRDKGIYTKLEGAKQNEAVQDLIIGGWSFNMPSA
ncbi:hypothetical protein D3H65_06325 [Paraflavitalea soli]|uniref:Uncharacterized protein n=1 Tax=Paraflavitalea soli TaxID=2315862 RepID=A0A3B7MKI2_9BACT|nr:hypothetical protein [Paraflavitalea soli]AXY73620.1 hypothetical protein D3H65_06325 [Paraflavitalea soli]